MYRRWKSTYTFRWTPILTYTRRHLSLLEWYEKNIEPVAVLEKSDSVGVALLSADLRVTVRRSAMIIESGLSGHETANLMPAVTGILDILEPKDIILDSARSMATVELTDADYSESCARFATKCSTSPIIGDGFRPKDASALVDLDSETKRVQVEWGIVQDAELLRRLTDPNMTRVAGEAEEARRIPLSRARALVGNELPQVSVLVETKVHRKTGWEAHDTDSVGAVIANADGVSQAVSESLAAGFLNEIGEGQ
jgi:hypothetical protein